MSSTASQYLVPVGAAAIVLFALALALAALARRGIGTGVWKALVAQRAAVGVLVAVLLFVVAFITFLTGKAQTDRRAVQDSLKLSRATNLMCVEPACSQPWAVLDPATGKIEHPDSDTLVSAGSSVGSSLIAVRPGATYRYGVYTQLWGGGTTQALVRMLWLDRTLSVLDPLWSDSPVWQVAAPDTATPAELHMGQYKAPAGAAWLRFQVWNRGTATLVVSSPKVSQDGVYVEQHPNGAQASLAFSFDWESAMGGPVHSQGMTQHDPAGATVHGLEMRQGADWLNTLFSLNNIHATFYATGYNLIDGNKERRTFSSDPVYKWASAKYRWSSDYWLTHKWYSDDPYGTYTSDPAWYFGDQTRALLKAGHEIASHTFGHLYVRGSNPAELATDMDEWLSASRNIGVPPPSTFAFPWRSSNSISDPRFYDVLYKRGIHAVTRLYSLDLKDLYTVGAVGVYSDIAVMPDFLLGAPSLAAGEEATGGAIGMSEGLHVIDEAVSRRGTISFWTHPEQLSANPALAGVRDVWSGVVRAAANARANGLLWIDTVSNITGYQTGVMSVTASLEQGQGGDALVRVQNNSGTTLQGVTFTMPGEVSSVFLDGGEVVLTVFHPQSGVIRLSAPGKPVYPARQLVVPALKPGTTTVTVHWTPGQEPPP